MIALDSNVVIDLMRGRPEVRENHYEALCSGVPMLLSTLVVEELTFAIDRHPASDRERSLMRAVTAGMAIAPFEEQDAAAAGLTRSAMEAQGQRAPYADFLIGAHALARGHALVTANTRHFINIPGLRLLDWTLAPHDESSPDA